MGIMLSPIAGRSFSTRAGNIYTADDFGIIPNVVSPADMTDLQNAGCAVLSPPPTDLLFSLRAANFNVATDQLLVPTFNGSFRIKRVTVTNASVSLTTAVGGFYTAAAKGGTAIVAAGQVYSALTAALLALDCTLAVTANVWPAATPLFLSLTTPQGAPATADIFVYGDVYG